MTISSHRLDALFLHVPRIRGTRREIMVLPLGVPALANLLADDGWRTEIWHLGVEREVSPGFSLRAELLRHRPRLVLLSLHWNQQTRPVLTVAERVKGWLPEATLVLGGLTASVFAEELMRLPFVDGVIHGDGEQPLRELARVVLGGRGTLAEVPNLLRRDEDGEVRRSEHSWALAPESAAHLRHGDLSLLRNARTYLAEPRYADFSATERGTRGYAWTGYISAGRGCVGSCLCCGGAALSQRITSGRSGVLLYPREKLMRDLGDLRDRGVRTLRMSFDPPAHRDAMMSWFETIRGRGLRFRVVYDLFDVPEPGFLEALAQTFAPGSMVVLSPECGSEEVRRQVRPPGFDNADLLRTVEHAEKLGLSTHCFFSAGLPGERRQDIDATARLIEMIRDRTGAGISVTPMTLDPASPLWLAPDRFGVRLLRRSLADFFDERGLPGGPGYETESFRESDILAACDRLLRVAGLPPLSTL